VSSPLCERARYLCTRRNTHWRYPGLAGGRRRAFSIVLIGNQIADSGRGLPDLQLPAVARIAACSVFSRRTRALESSGFIWGGSRIHTALLSPAATPSVSSHRQALGGFHAHERLDLPGGRCQIRTRPIIADGGQHALPSHGHGGYSAVSCWPQSRIACWARWPARVRRARKSVTSAANLSQRRGGSWRSDRKTRWTVSASKSPPPMPVLSPGAATSSPGERSRRVTVPMSPLARSPGPASQPAGPVRADGYPNWPGW
jgi:hypothetical protein